MTATVLAAAIIYRRPIEVLADLGIVEQIRPYLGLLYLGQIVAFWAVAAIGQWLAMRRRVPYGGRWGIMTFLGGLVATFAYVPVGSLLQPVWAELFGVRVNSVGRALFLFRTDNLAQTLFFALQGAVFGCLFGLLQSLTLPFHWRGRASFVGLSILAGAIALGLVWFTHATAVMTSLARFWGIVLGFVGVTSFISSLFWIVYSALTGVGLHRLLRLWRRSQHDAITSSFD